MSRIFYFNITYGCNSNCVFCYSHNTQHNNSSFQEISQFDFQNYLKEHLVTESDRVILNGGEPLLNTQIDDLMGCLRDIGCEVLIYSNGIRLVEVPCSVLSPRFRFIVPIHGHEALHDSITRNVGSWRKTLDGMRACFERGGCLLDLKVILNAYMYQTTDSWEKTCAALSKVPFNHAVHLTQMADTIISRKNGCHQIRQEVAKRYTRLLFELFLPYNCKIKLYDTCVAGLGDYLPNGAIHSLETPDVFFKDFSQFRKLELSHAVPPCAKDCREREMCLSAVGQYKVLEYFQGNVYQSLE